MRVNFWKTYPMRMLSICSDERSSSYTILGALMHHEEEYKGHTISVYTTELGRGHIWNYQIDGGPIRRQQGDRPQSEEIALGEGVGEAKYVVDQMAKAK